VGTASLILDKQLTVAIQESLTGCPHQFAMTNSGLLPPRHPLELVAEEHVAQHQAAHHGLGLGKLGDRHVEVIKAGELHHEARRPVQADEQHQQELRPPQEGMLVFPELQVADRLAPLQLIARLCLLAAARRRTQLLQLGKLHLPETPGKQEPP